MRILPKTDFVLAFRIVGSFVGERNRTKKKAESELAMRFIKLPGVLLVFHTSIVFRV